MGNATKDMLKEFHGDRKGIRGFTLIELLVSLVIGLVVLYGLYDLFTFQQKTYSVQERVVEMQQSARAAMDMMETELCMAGYNPANLSSTGITSASANSITFKQDLDGNGNVTGTNENITYSYDSGSMRITRNAGSGAVSLAENVEALNFSYYDANGATTATPANIKKIKIAMRSRTSRQDPAYGTNNGYRTFMLSCFVIPRNLDY
ncbi:Type IV pilin N-term methylation site GFxxxE [Syntrophus gentianae]|uniref:Type IV pilin N-term methylation site GFxxxE n=1 Tax=Syntrophus gentianae TaxID=43775 RepID=A0A1H7VAW6_9BACT|nr:prepilin-type N-terminal cleavage/methylation domain-containing protein [Syntrophus gentianae]SEM06392.1 Type IV pilin N-term methylation site GFxxxE [Syntrophus gentianae]